MGWMKGWLRIGESPSSVSLAVLMLAVQGSHRCSLVHIRTGGLHIMGKAPGFSFVHHNVLEPIPS